MSLAPRNILLPFLAFAGLIIALFAGIFVAEERLLEISFVVGCVLLVVWAVYGQNVWWMPIFFITSLGGVFYFGFKIYAHEIGVLLCLLPMILALAIKKNLSARFTDLPVVMLLLTLYIVAHYIAVISYHIANGLGGFGNISRRYMDALWPLLILIPFLWAGKTNKIKWLLPIIGIASFLRFSLGFAIAQLDVQELLYIPGINYVPAANNIQDLRVSGSSLATVCLLYFCLTKSNVIRTLLLVLLAFAVYGTFMGGGRITIILLSGVFGFLFLIYRNFALISIWIVTVLITILVLNTVPEVLYGAHEKVRRAASAFLVDRAEAGDLGETEISDIWHARLSEAGWQSWTESPMTILFGRGTSRFEERAWQEGQNFEGMVEMATLTSRFEKGLWNVLATFGLIGMVLYSILLTQIIRVCTPILFRDRIASPVHAVMFMAVYSCITWFLLCWISGDFPSYQLMLGIVAMVAAYDLKLYRKKPKTEINLFDYQGNQANIAFAHRKD